MNIQPITMDPRIANIHYHDYRKRVNAYRKERMSEAQKKIAEGGKIFRAGRTERSLIEKEDEVLMKSYRALSKGMRIINVADVIRKGGFDTKQKLPKLAIAGADWGSCFLRHAQGQIIFGESGWQVYRYGAKTFAQTAGRRCIAFPAQGFAPEITNATWRSGQSSLPRLDGGVKSIVPSIPTHLRPTGKLEDYTILWEAEWSYMPPVDPILLKHIAGNMYSVLAQWDLTPLEQLVLEGRIG